MTSTTATIRELAEAQIDGRACTDCGGEAGTVVPASMPSAGPDGPSQTFRCAGGCVCRIAGRDVLDALRGYDPDVSSASIVDVAIAEIERLRGIADPVRDANGDTVPRRPEDMPKTGLEPEQLRGFFSGRVPAGGCGHYIAKSEAEAGYRKCEDCAGPPRAPRGAL